MKLQIFSLVVLVLLFWSLPAAGDYRDAREALKQKSFAEAAREFQELASIGNADASYAYAQMLEKGQGQDVDPVLARAWFALAEDQGHEKAGKNVAKLARKLDASALAQSDVKAQELISSHGRSTISELLIPGNEGRENLTRKFSYKSDFKLPAMANFHYKATVVNLDFDTSAQGVPRDFHLVREVQAPYVEQVIKVFSRQRFEGYGGAFAINRKIQFASSDTRDQYGPGKLLRKLRKRAENGSPYRKFYYARAQEFAENFGYQNTRRDSNDWYLQSAIGGYAKAQYILGYRLLTGFTLVEDSDKGLRWLAVAAENGNARANYMLARLYRADGDLEKTVRHLTAASEAGHTTAMLWLARYLNEQGDADAMEWLERAKPHLDQVSWHQVAAELYAGKNANQVQVHQQEAASLAQTLGIPLEPLTPLVIRSPTPS